MKIPVTEILGISTCPDMLRSTARQVRAGAELTDEYPGKGKSAWALFRRPLWSPLRRLLTTRGQLLGDRLLVPVNEDKIVHVRNISSG